MKNLKDKNKPLKKFIINTNGLTKKEAEDSLYDLMSDYKEDINFDNENGEITINGDIKLPFTKDMGFPNKK